MTVATADKRIDTFISRWQGLQGGRERSNSQMFLSELAEALGLEKPAPSHEGNRAYSFERAITFRAADGSSSTGWIDLYKKGCFVLEAKQSRQKDGKKSIPGQSDLFKADEETANLGRRTADRAWDVLMLNARRQAEEYAKALEPSEGWPPFLLICDVGHCIEVLPISRGRKKLPAVPGPQRLSHLSGRVAGREDRRAPARDLERPALARPNGAVREGHARDRRAPRSGFEGAGGAQAQRRGCGAVSHALPVHDVCRGREAAARGLLQALAGGGAHQAVQVQA
jgi:hypothetical protein